VVKPRSGLRTPREGGRCVGWVSINLVLGRKLWGSGVRLRLFLSSPLALPGAGLRMTTRAFGLDPCLCVVNGLGQETCAYREAAYWVGVFICVFAMLTKWFSLTRLETRTKESNIYASIWVVNPDA